RLLPIVMEEPSEVLDPVLKSESPRMSDEQDSCDESVSQPEILAKDLKKLTLDPSAKKAPPDPMKMRLVENK
ncbi:hypothetical protein A6R68_11883, partial [Neotoma lepida]